MHQANAFARLHMDVNTHLLRGKCAYSIVILIELTRDSTEGSMNDRKRNVTALVAERTVQVQAQAERVADVKRQELAGVKRFSRVPLQP